MIRVHGKAKYYKGAYKDTEEDRARYPLYSADSLELFNPPSAWLFDDFTNNTCLRTFPPRSQGGVRLVLGLCRFDDAFPPLLRRCRQGRYQVGLFRSPTIPSTPPLTASRPHMPAIRA